MPAALILAILLLSKITWAYPLGLQDQADLDVSVSLGVDIAARGGEVRLSMLLDPHGLSVLSVKSRISFPGEYLVFKKVELSSLIDQEEKERISVASETSTPSEEGLEGVEVLIQSNSTEPLPSGVLAVLVFSIAEEATPGDVAVKNAARVVIGGPQQAGVVQSKDGTITILEETPYFACFFYMH